MAFLLFRSGRQLVRSSSSWAAKPQLTRVLTSVHDNNNCFSTDSSLGSMNQELDPKDEAALKYLFFSCGAYFAKNMVNAHQNKLVSSTDDFHKFLDGFPDLLEKLTHDDQTKDPALETALKDMLVAESFGRELFDAIYQNKPLPSDEDGADMPPLTAAESFGKKLLDAIYHKKPLPDDADADFDKFVDGLIEELPAVDPVTIDSKSESDLSEKNPKAVTPDMIKAASVFSDVITKGLLNYIPKRPAFKDKGDNFNVTRDSNGLDLTVDVCGLAKEHLVVWFDRDRLLVASTNDVAPDRKVREAITMPDDHNYDADKVTGTIMKDGQLKISFPVSKEGGEPKEKYFQVSLV